MWAQQLLPTAAARTPPPFPPPTHVVGSASPCTPALAQRVRGSPSLTLLLPPPPFPAHRSRSPALLAVRSPISITMGRSGNRGAMTYHATFLALLLIGGAGFLGVGLWLQLSKGGGPVNLEWTGSGFIDSFLTLGVASMIVGGALLATSVFALCAVSRSCIGTVFRVMFVLATLVVTAGLVLIAVATLLIASNNRPGAVEDIVRDSWERTVSSDDRGVVNEACTIQRDFECAGFAAGDCDGCNNGVGPARSDCATRCPVCEPRTPASSSGCYDAIIDRTRKIFLPVGITAAVLAAVALVDVFVVCAI